MCPLTNSTNFAPKPCVQNVIEINASVSPLPRSHTQIHTNPIKLLFVIPK